MLGRCLRSPSRRSRRSLCRPRCSWVSVLARFFQLQDLGRSVPGADNSSHSSLHATWLYSFRLMIVVTGATGRVGGLVARRLESGGHPMRLLARDPQRAPRINGAQVQAADYGNPELLAAGLQKGDRVFMVSLWICGDTSLDLHRLVI